jgi:hypothetical protein
VRGDAEAIFPSLPEADSDAARRRLAPVPAEGPAGDALASWAERSGRRRTFKTALARRRRDLGDGAPPEDYQDPVTSRARRLGQAVALLAGSRRPPRV